MQYPYHMWANLHFKMLILTLGLLFFFLVSDAIAPPPISIKGVHWARDGTKWA